MPVFLSKILLYLKPELVSSQLLAREHETIEGFSYDSRNIQKDQIFFCLSGEKTKGINFVHHAYLKGVRCFIVSKKEQFFFKRILTCQKVNLIVVKDVVRAYGIIAKNYLKLFSGIKIAITGSVGKTSLKEILAEVLSTSYSVYKSQGNFNNQLGVPYNIFNINRNHDFYVFELGMNHKNEISYLSNMVNPEITIINSIHSAHIGNFKHLEEIALAKSEIFLGQKKPGLVFLPQKMNQNQTVVNCIPQGLKMVEVNQNDIIVQHEISPSFKLKYSFYDKISKLTREERGINLFEENYSFALAVGQYFKVDRKMALEQITINVAAPHRLKVVHDNPFVIDDTYNANAHTIGETLKKLIALKKNYFLNVILGDILELGDKVESIYLNLAKRINGFFKKKLVKEQVRFFLLGSKIGFMKIIFNHLETKEKKYFSNQISLQNELLKKVEKNSFYYFKASRGVFLNHSVHHFTRFLKQ